MRAQKVKSVDKLMLNENQLCHLGKRPPKNPQSQRQNISRDSSFISLKPYQRSSSKPNILINPPIQVPQTQPSHFIVPLQPVTNNMNIVNHSITSFIPSNTSQTIRKNIGQTNFEPNREGENSGYGTVENPYPQFIQNKRIGYHNLFNIGKAWLKFQGNFSQGCKEGPGTIYLTNGHLFTGFFERDLANGKGTVYVDGELVLKGIWRDNILVTQF